MAMDACYIRDTLAEKLLHIYVFPLLPCTGFSWYRKAFFIRIAWTKKIDSKSMRFSEKSWSPKWTMERQNHDIIILPHSNKEMFLRNKSYFKRYIITKINKSSILSSEAKARSQIRDSDFFLAFRHHYIFLVWLSHDQTYVFFLCDAYITGRIIVMWMAWQLNPSN